VRFEKVFIPLGASWSTPFCRWQGSLSGISSWDLAETAARSALAERGIPAAEMTQVVLGFTIPQPGAFYGAPTLAARLGAPDVAGPMVSQGCATSAGAIHLAASQIEAGDEGPILVLATDRTSNGPHMVFPAMGNMGGAPYSEDWVLENFSRDPWAGEAMIQTAENVASEAGFTRESLDELTLMRHEQYKAALADDRAFQRRYMVPVEIPGRKPGDSTVIDADVGVHGTTAEGLRGLKPSVEGGLTTPGSQTHPGDGAAGTIVASENRARPLGRDGAVVQLLASGMARAGKAQMPKAPVPAARAALTDAGLDFDDVDMVMTHNPFAVNDLWFIRETGVEAERMNPYGCSLVYGHPGGPTGARAVAELIEGLCERGGGVGLFTGCSAGDTGGALVLRVDG
jgi:acetyl-CoA C-acetyltransferase